MANEEHLAILKQGVKVWNQWRKENLYVKPEIGVADFRGADLQAIDFRGVHFVASDFSGADLDEADFRRSNLVAVNLSKAYLRRVHFRGAYLRGINFTETYLSKALLYDAYICEANLYKTDLTGALVGFTTFGDVDLRYVIGLETIKHTGPSTIGIDTIYRSGGNIPEVFLRSAGVPDNLIAYMKSLTGKAFDFYSCFISYSSQDEAFAQRLYNDLQGKGVRCWFAPKDMRIGDEIRGSIDQAIRLHDKVLLVLSQHSIDSRWVQKEVETAFEQEAQHSKPMLFPIRLDDTVMTTSQAWAADIRRMKHIGDFTRWKQHDAYQQAFEQLLRALKAEKTGKAGEE